MLLFSIFFALLYAVGLNHLLYVIGIVISFDGSIPSVGEIVYMFGVFIAILILYHILAYYGRRKHYWTKSLIVAFCAIDLLSVGSVFLLITFLSMGGRSVFKYLRIIVTPTPSVAAYWLLVFLLIHRVCATKSMLRSISSRTGSRTGDGTVS